MVIWFVYWTSFPASNCILSDPPWRKEARKALEMSRSPENELLQIVQCYSVCLSLKMVLHKTTFNATMLQEKGLPKTLWWQNVNWTRVLITVDTNDQNSVWREPKDIRVQYTESLMRVKHCARKTVLTPPPTTIPVHPLQPPPPLLPPRNYLSLDSSCFGYGPVNYERDHTLPLPNFPHHPPGYLSGICHVLFGALKTPYSGVSQKPYDVGLKGIRMPTHEFFL